MFLVAPDSFKGTFSAATVAHAIARGIRAESGIAREMPVADGGEGTLDALAEPLGLGIVVVDSVNPWGVPASGRYGLSDSGTALIEIASVSGITTVHNGFRDPIAASTRGTGILVVDAYRRGARHIVIAAGGSATTDGGAGAIEAIEDAGGLSGARVEVLTDVTTTYLDAAQVFGPQKGANTLAVNELTGRLDTFASTLPKDPRGVPGTGAAGGFAGGMWAQFDAALRSGADFVLDAIGFGDALTQASAVIVGEGRLDSQSAAGKIVSAILARADAVPVIAVVGSVGDDLGAYRDRFFDVLVATDRQAMTEAGKTLARKVRVQS
ncbi:glycerate kinase [Rhodococcus sp. B10]|uniref:glycerate kinase family protein n=1 Tax=Rhodococcus sp. B10 TaxID=2695876 RepID=UPI00142F49EA|nr:glycerate kinase [Rhodococcus sp. B10]NIL78893.1 Glycerate 2-kinase [Rhodococcus sp. B10]